jgi:hypothetical protein
VSRLGGPTLAPHLHGARQELAGPERGEIPEFSAFRVSIEAGTPLRSFDVVPRRPDTGTTTRATPPGAGAIVSIWAEAASQLQQ